MVLVLPSDGLRKFREHELELIEGVADQEGLTAEEITRDQPEEAERMQMTDARCKRCSDKKVGLVDIIQAGTGDRYQLECTSCIYTWYASIDEASALTIDGPSATSSVGTAP